MFVAALTITSFLIFPQDKAAIDYLNQAVLVQNEITYTAKEIIKKVSEHNPTLSKTLQNDAEYCKMYLQSTLFWSQVRAYSNWILLNDAEIPTIAQNLTEEAAKKWGKLRGRKGNPQAILATDGIQVEVEARLLAITPKNFSMKKIRARFNESVPEFFGEIQASIIRIPMTEIKTGKAISKEERKRIWSLLTETGEKISAGKMSWEMAHKELSKDPSHARNYGRMNLLKPTMPGKHSPEFLREVFKGYGINLPILPLLRGPIITKKWASLIRIEALNIRGVAEMNFARSEIIQALRRDLIDERLRALQFREQIEILGPFSK